MEWLGLHFFTELPANGHLLLNCSHNPFLVLLAYLVACAAGFGTLDMAERVGHVEDPTARRHWRWLGAMLAVGVDAGLIRWGFIGFLLAITLYNLFKLYGSARQPVNGSRFGWRSYGALGVLAGTTGGLFGVGGAVVAAPVLTSVFGTSQVVAQGLSLALAAPSTTVTLLTYAAHGEVNWLMGLPMAVGGLLSISWGVKVAYAMPERLLRGLYCCFLLLCAALLAVKV